MTRFAPRAARLIAATALIGLAACTSDKPFQPFGPGEAEREYKPGAEMTPAAGASAPAAPAPTVAALAVDPLNAPPPPSDGMLVPPPATDTSQRVPLGTLAANQAQPAAPTSLLTPPGQTPPGQTPPAAKPPAPAPAPAPVQATPAPQPPPPPVQMAQAAPAPVAPQPAAPPKAAPPPAPAPKAVAQRAPEPKVMSAPPPAATKGERILRLHMPDGSIAAVPGDESNTETVVISSKTTPPQTQSLAREFVPASLTPAPVVRPPGPGEIPLSAAEKNSIQRFEILKRLEDEALITGDEYAKRRAANVGALLPYTHEPGGYGLERPVPSSDAIVARLAALRRSFEARAITAQQHALERTMILNALLPEVPDERMDRKPPPKDMIEGAAEAGELEALHDKKLITTEEMEAEKAAIEHAVKTGLLPSQEPARPARRTTTAATSAAKSATATPAKSAGAEQSAMDTPITGPVVHVGSYGSEAGAMRAWQDIFSKDLNLLGSVKPIVRRVDLGDKGIFYRLMVGSYGNLADAEAACVKLKGINLFCRASQDGS